MNRLVRFDFSGLTVLLASRGYQVSCYTTVGGVDVKNFPRNTWVVELLTFEVYKNNFLRF